MTFHPTGNPAFWKETADTCYAQERFDEAARAYLQAAELMPNDAESWTGRGKALCALARYPDAVAALERALVLAPDNCDALECLAEAFGKEGAAEKRAACLLRLSDLQGKSL
ncbi:MAG TPA: tetratricopeptide repeat protein [Methanocorpusculum sp.]|nr:tetratricopeptide repeat protein [Methanocorpusculum sp.]